MNNRQQRKPSGTDRRPDKRADTIDWTPVLAFLPRFRAPGFVPGRWNTHEPTSDGVMQMPWVELSPEVEAFLRTLTQQEVTVPFDWPTWVSDRGEQLVNDDTALAQADLDDLRRLLTALIRQDRFHNHCGYGRAASEADPHETIPASIRVGRRSACLELSCQVVGVWAAPLFDDLPVTDAPDVEQVHLDLLPGGPDAEELTAMGSSHDRSKGEAVIARNHILHLDADVRERGEEALEQVDLVGPSERWPSG